jgi:hypothetical protein
VVVEAWMASESAGSVIAPAIGTPAVCKSFLRVIIAHPPEGDK